MTDKELMHAVLAGHSGHRLPVAVLYSNLYHQDHFCELTGRPGWHWWKWLYSDPDEHVKILSALVEQAPFDIVQPQWAPTRQERENAEFIEVDGRPFLRDRRSGTLTPLESRSGHARDEVANQQQTVFDRHDADRLIKPVPAHEIVESGVLDHAQAAVSVLGRDRFIMAGGLTGTLWACTGSFGMTNLLALLAENPDLVEYVSWKHLEQQIETIRAIAAVGGDAIFIDDALAGCDMISVAQYERFCLPTLAEMVREVHRLGHKAILIYFGGIADRLAQIASLGADGLSMECSMKGYVNDIDQIAEAIGHQVTLFGNVDPVGVLQNGSDQLLEREVRRQVAAGRKARGFVLSTGSPITPATPLARVRRFIELGRAAAHNSRETSL